MSGRKPKAESRSEELRQALVAWQQMPEGKRPSLRQLARERGTSHQLLSHLLEGLEGWRRNKGWSSSVPTQQPRVCRLRRRWSGATGPG